MIISLLCIDIILLTNKQNDERQTKLSVGPTVVEIRQNIYLTLSSISIVT